MMSYFNFVSPPITLYYKKKLKHNNIGSIIISTISLLLIISFSIIFSLDFFLHKNPINYYYIKYVEDTGKYIFNSDSIFHFITLGEEKKIFSYDKRAFTIIGVNFYGDYRELKSGNYFEYDHWIYDKCSLNDINDKYIYLENYTEKYNKRGVCIEYFYNSSSKKIITVNDSDFSYPIEQHGNSNINEIMYGIFIIACQNNSYNNFSCYDKLTIYNKIMEAYTYKLYFLSNYIELNNYKEPLIYYYQKVSNLFNGISYTINHMNFNTVKLITYNGIILDNSYDINSYVYITNEKLVTERDESNDYIYGGFYFWMKNTQQTYTRKYKMIQEICGSIAGIINIIITLAKLFNILFHHFAIYKDLNLDISLNYKSLSNRIIKRSTSHKILNHSLNNIKTVKNNYVNTLNNSNSFNNLENSNNDIIKNEKVKQTYVFPLSKNYNKNEILKESSKFSKKFYSLSNINRRRNIKFEDYFFSLYNNNNLDYNILNTLYGYKKIKFLDFFINLIPCYYPCKKFKNSLFKNRINNLIDFRKNIISEEAMFSLFYIQTTLDKVLLNREKK